MSEEEQKPSAQAPISHTSPLRDLLIEFHEVYKELEEVGFSDDTSAKILANMLLDVVLYRDNDTGIELELDDEDEEEDDSDGTDTDGTAGVE